MARAIAGGRACEWHSRARNDMSMPASAVLSRWDRAPGPASDVGRDRHSKRTSSLRIASSPAAKTPSASFRRGVRDHSFCTPKASNGSAIVNKDGRVAPALVCAPRPQQGVMSLVGRLCCESPFAVVTKNSPGCRREFRVKMWGTDDKLTGDVGNVIETT
jgi:hypothetical protein